MGRNVVTQTAEIVERLEQLERHNRRQRCALYIIGGFAIVVVVTGAQGAPEVLDELRVKKLTIVSDDKWERCVFDGNGGELMAVYGGPDKKKRITIRGTEKGGKGYALSMYDSEQQYRIHIAVDSRARIANVRLAGNRTPMSYKGYIQKVTWKPQVK